MHEDQLEIGAAAVRRLVAGQFPQWRGLPVRALRTSGTDNAIFRIGVELAARFPLRPGDPVARRATLVDEAAACRELATASTVPTPEPVAFGDPGEGYPQPWSVQTWVPGRDATVADPSASTEASTQFALDLAALIARLRAVDTRGRTFRGTGRGGHLADHDDWIATCLRHSEELLDVERWRARWEVLRTLPEVDADLMCHGDLTPPNVLVGDGRLVGLLDGGGFGPADPALDLVAAWHLLDAQPRAAFRRALGCTDVQWRRGMAWAFQQAVGLVWYYAESNPVMSAWGRRTLQRLDDAEPG